ncbi:MAG: amino acid ABC transporter substrate-binding protein [Acidobacteria bacterium]|nr:MAG: amino acid ABC transporter substrate-binding protein [Acidobacteriota bacterium]
MQLLPLQKLDGCRLWIATLGLALFAPAFLMSADKTQAPADTLARVRQTGTFRLGYYADAGPFSYQDETGKPAGYAISLCQQIAKDLKNEIGLPNLDVEFVLVTGADRFDAVRQGKVDLLCGPSVETFARRSQVSFSIPIFPAGLAALVRADAPAQIRDVLSGHEPPYRPLWRGSIGLALQNRTFSAVTNTTALNWLTGKLDEFKIDAKVVPVESHDQGVQRVLNRSSDVLFGERSILLDAKKRNPAGGDLIVLDRLFTYEPLALALARGSEDLRLLVDKSLSSLSRSGETQNLYKRFFGEPDENALTFFRMNTIAD